jgi:hypothetical protein
MFQTDLDLARAIRQTSAAEEHLARTQMYEHLTRAYIYKKREEELAERTLAIDRDIGRLRSKIRNLGNMPDSGEMPDFSILLNNISNPRFHEAPASDDSESEAENVTGLD